ncbi:MAG: Uma2 family endonuclease [Desulfamplus sp.]|nr:Uma2 family endonuclease [Desulfamplus sp.]
MVNMLLQEKTGITPEEYLALERESEIKNEYFGGEIFAMAGASSEHNKISTNIVRVLGNQLLEKPCNIFSSDMKVKMKEIKKYTYPDIVVVCGNEEYDDENNDILLNPIMIIEILSDSTEAYDRGDKFSHYQLIGTFSEYILISQYFPKVEKFLRQKNNTWIYSKYEKLEDIVSIESIKCELPMSDVYRKVNYSEYHMRRNQLVLKT